MRTSNEILDEIMYLKKIKTDLKISELFNVSPTTVSSWRSRNAIPYDKIFKFCEDEGYPLEFIFYGKKGITNDDLALIRTLNICGEEYKKRVYIAACIRAQNVLDEKKLETKELLQAKRDMETLSTASIE